MPKRTQPLSTYVEQDWQKVEGRRADDDLEWAAAEGGEDPEEWECVACGKSFRSEAAWDSHERSKKHMKEVERLKREMEEDNEKLGLADEAEVDEGVGQPPEPANLDEVTGTEVGLPSLVNHESDPTLPEPDDDITFDAVVRGQKTGDNVDDLPVVFGRKWKRKGEPPPQEIQTKMEKQVAPIPPPSTDAVLQEPAECIQPQVELSKREKRRLREAKKAQASKSSIQVSVCGVSTSEPLSADTL